MNRTQRRAHARLWPLLALAILAILAAALVTKARVDRAALEAAVTQPERQ